MLVSTTSGRHVWCGDCLQHQLVAVTNTRCFLCPLTRDEQDHAHSSYGLEELEVGSTKGTPCLYIYIYIVCRTALGFFLHCFGHQKNKTPILLTFVLTKY